MNGNLVLRVMILIIVITIKLITETANWKINTIVKISLSLIIIIIIIIIIILYYIIIIKKRSTFFQSMEMHALECLETLMLCDEVTQL